MLPRPSLPGSAARPWRAIVALLALVAGTLLSGHVAAAERLRLLRYSVPAPAHWMAQAPTSNFRLAQFRVPAAPGAAEGEVVVFHFGRGQGGSAAQNIARWTSQFSDPAGGPVTPRVETLQVGGLPATLVELAGTYERGLAGMNAPAKPGQVLLSAIVEAPEGNVTFQLHGDRATVEGNRRAFLDMLAGWTP